MRTLVYHAFAAGGGISAERLRRTAGQFERDLPVLKRKGDIIDLDDALLSQYQIALPLLNKHGMRARFFVPTGRIGHPWHMNWDQLREVAKNHAVECHTHSHGDMRNFSDEEARADLDLACRIIEKEIGFRPRFIAFPYEEVTGNLLRVAAECGLIWVGLRATVTNMMDEKVPVSSADYWTSVYSGERKAEPGGHEHYRVAEVLKHVEGPRVLDAGAGYAPVAKAIRAAHPDWEVLALDICRKVADLSGFTPYLVCSCYHVMACDKSFDTVVACQLLEYLEDEAAFLREAARIGRHIIVTVPNGLHSACSQLRVYDPDKLERLMAAFGKLRQLYVSHAMIFCKIEVTPTPS